MQGNTTTTEGGVVAGGVFVAKYTDEIGNLRSCIIGAPPTATSNDVNAWFGALVRSTDEDMVPIEVAQYPHTKSTVVEEAFDEDVGEDYSLSEGSRDDEDRLPQAGSDYDYIHFSASDNARKLGKKDIQCTEIVLLFGWIGEAVGTLMDWFGDE